MILKTYMTKSYTSHGHVYEPSHQNRCTVSLHHDAPYTATIATKSHQNSWNNNYDIMIHLLSESTIIINILVIHDPHNLHDEIMHISLPITFLDFTWTCSELPLLLRHRTCNELVLMVRHRAVRTNIHAGRDMNPVMHWPLQIQSCNELRLLPRDHVQ